MKNARRLLMVLSILFTGASLQAAVVLSVEGNIGTKRAELIKVLNEHIELQIVKLPIQKIVDSKISTRMNENRRCNAYEFVQKTAEWIAIDTIKQVAKAKNHDIVISDRSLVTTEVLGKAMVTTGDLSKDQAKNLGDSISSYAQCPHYHLDGMIILDMNWEQAMNDHLARYGVAGTRAPYHAYAYHEKHFKIFADMFKQLLDGDDETSLSHGVRVFHVSQDDFFDEEKQEEILAQLLYFIGELSENK